MVSNIPIQIPVSDTGIVLTPEEIAQKAYQAGFRGNGLATIVAIALHESGGHEGIIVQNTGGAAPGSYDRGLLQFNSHFWSQIPNSCALNADCALQKAYQITQGGTNFAPWQWDFTHGYVLETWQQAVQAIRNVFGEAQTQAIAQPAVQTQGVSAQTALTSPTPNGSYQWQVGPWTIDLTGLVRILWVILGILSILVGILLLSRDDVTELIKELKPV